MQRAGQLLLLLRQENHADHGTVWSLQRLYTSSCTFLGPKLLQHQHTALPTTRAGPRSPWLEQRGTSQQAGWPYTDVELERQLPLVKGRPQLRSLLVRSPLRGSCHPHKPAGKASAHPEPLLLLHVYAGVARVDSKLAQHRAVLRRAHRRQIRRDVRQQARGIFPVHARPVRLRAGMPYTARSCWSACSADPAHA